MHQPTPLVSRFKVNRSYLLPGSTIAALFAFAIWARGANSYIQSRPSEEPIASGSSNQTSSRSGSRPAAQGDSKPDAERGASSNISGYWANEGGDKVTQDELRATRHTENKTGTVRNRAWDGTNIKLSAARNEVVSFNLVLEAANASATNVSVTFDKMTGPGGAVIESKRTTVNGVFNWVNRPIELFYARYMKIEGLSFFGYGKDESQIPVRFQAASHKWADRPDHDKMYPDALVPLELVNTFSIARGRNQSIWSDIYVPKTAAPGTYTGSVFVRENGVVTKSIPVHLSVSKFRLPDLPTAKTVAFLDNSDVEWRYETGHGGYAQWDHPAGRHVQAVMDTYFQFFHRHKIATIGENECPPADHPCDSSVPRLNGSLYTAAHGYDGPGVNTPVGVFSIGSYGTWGGATYGVPEWKNDEMLFRRHLDGWATWFSANLPDTQYFLYLQDEPPPADYPKVQKWANWILTNPGPGKAVSSFSTLSAVNAQTGVPSLAIPATQAGVGNCPAGPCNNTAAMNNAYAYFTRPGTNRRFWIYNDGRPGVGSSMIEDDGVAFRTFGWAQFKKGINRWFYWYANVNSNYDTYSTATSWGDRTRFDGAMGMWGDHAPSNGNGLLVYPGTDKDHRSTSYGVEGPVATLRLKEWRRGVQDADYLALARQIDPASTARIVSEVMPKALWEYTVPDPTYVTVPPTWSPNPDDWEARRAQLASMISTYCTSHSDAAFCR